MKLLRIAAALALVALLTGPALARSRWKGMCSFYDGRGYPPMSAAHRTLPKGTWVRVTNPRSGRSVEVVIADRGPFIKGRILDLTEYAARRFGMIEAGVVPIELTLISEDGAEMAPIERVLRCTGRPALADEAPAAVPAAEPHSDYLRRKTFGFSTLLMHRSPLFTQAL